MVKLLLKYEADPNVKTKAGSTPLHCAAADGNLQVVEILLQNGSQINTTNSGGWTPLHCAANKGIWK